MFYISLACPYDLSCEITSWPVEVQTHPSDFGELRGSLICFLVTHAVPVPHYLYLVWNTGPTSLPLRPCLSLPAVSRLSPACIWAASHHHPLPQTCSVSFSPLRFHLSSSPLSLPCCPGNTKVLNFSSALTEQPPHSSVALLPVNTQVIFVNLQKQILLVN